MEIGDLIRLKRAELKLSQRDVATALNVSPSAVAQWELNDTRPTNENMAALRRLLGVGFVHPAGSSPFTGQVVDDLDELALLDFWRSLTRDERLSMLRMLRIGDRSDRKVG